MAENENRKSENIETLKGRIFLLSITGEVEGHEALSERVDSKVLFE